MVECPKCKSGYIKRIVNTILTQEQTPNDYDNTPGFKDYIIEYICLKCGKEWVEY